MFDIFLRDLLARIRDKSALILGVGAPLLLIVILGGLSRGPDAEQNQPIGMVLPQPPTTVGSLLKDRVAPILKDEKVALLNEYSTRQKAIDAIDAEDIDAAIVVHPADRRGDQTVEVVGAKGRIIHTAVASGIADTLTSQINAITDIVGATRLLAPNTQPPGPESVALRLTTGTPTVAVESDSATGGLTPETQVTAGMATFFLFFTVQFGLLGLLYERRVGTLARLLAAPITPRQVLMAKVLVSYVLGVLSMTVLIVAAHFLIGAEFGAPLGVALLILSGVAAATATIALVVGIARSPEQAGMAQSMIALILGLLGGAFFSLARSGDVGAFITKLAPHYWFSEGLARLSGGQAWTAAAGPVGVLLVFTVVIGVPGLILARRTVKP